LGRGGEEKTEGIILVLEGEKRVVLYGENLDI
jgi:hypothetical protein